MDKKYHVSYVIFPIMQILVLKSSEKLTIFVFQKIYKYLKVVLL